METDMKKVLQVLLNIAKRYGYYLSVALTSSHVEKIRESDIQIGNYIIFPEADKSDVICAIDRTLEPGSRCAIATFPFDFFTVDECISCLARRMEKTAKFANLDTVIITEG